MSTPARRRPRARLVWAGLAVLMAIGFVALGIWQVERRQWKLALIEQTGQRAHAPPVAAPGPGQWPVVDAATDAYRHVVATGTYLFDAETLVQAATELGAGHWVLTPLRTADGTLILVNRGFVPPERRAAGAHGPTAAARPEIVTGLLRISEPGGGFLRRNDPAANRWYSRDVAAIAAARGLHNAAPYFIDADADGAAASGASAEAPVGGLTVVTFANNHAVYAITWFTLALMSCWAGWRVLRDPAGTPLADGAHAARPIRHETGH